MSNDLDQAPEFLRHYMNRANGGDTRGPRPLIKRLGL